MKMHILVIVLSLALLCCALEPLIPISGHVMVRADADDPFIMSRAAASPEVKKMKNDADIAHGVLMGIAVVLVLPIGALTTRLPGGRTLRLRIHVFCQIFGLVLLSAGFCLGVWTCIIHTEVFTDPHTTFGTAIMGLFLIQPAFGYLHHRWYTEKVTRSWWTWTHIWFGRIILILAIINGGYGIKYAKNSPNGEIGYGVSAGLVGVVYIGLAVMWHLRGLQKTEHNDSEMMGDTGDLGEKHEEITMETPTTQEV